MDIIGKVKHFIKEILRKQRIKALGTKEVVIIADNCWGGEFYKEFERPFNTPFIGLYLNPPCFIPLLQDFDRIMALPLEFIQESRKYPPSPTKYPIGLLDGHIEVHFLHYHSEEEALDKWNRRVDRMLRLEDKNRYYFKFGVERREHLHYLDDFYKIPYRNKVSFAVWPYDDPRHVVMPDEKLADGLTLYHQAKKKFNIVKWLTKH